MIQDIAPHLYDNAYKPEAPDKDSIALYYEDHVCLMARTTEAIRYPRFEELEADNEEIYEEWTYLFTIDEQRYYLVEKLNLPGTSSFTLENTEIFRYVKPRHLAFAGITGYQLYQWYRDHRYCGRCGKRMKQDTKERMLYCESCKNMEYPKICPAVIIAVTHGDKILMSKYAGREYKKYALLAGFNETGESIEETVRREVMEEVGLKVKNLRYYKSQPWSFTDTLLMGFFCELDGEDGITLDTDELAMAEWFERDKMPVEAEDLSLTNEMMMAFKHGKV